ncbi:hypothetical protein EMCRGX_G029979 [Ephydatia muelleri]
MSLYLASPPRSIKIPELRLKGVEQLDEKDTVMYKTGDEVVKEEKVWIGDEPSSMGNGTVLEDIAANTQEELADDANHLEIRKKADAAYLKAIEKMGHKYSKHNGHHIQQFAVGDNGSVRILCIDRAKTDLQRLPCIVVEIVGKACIVYHLCCKVGVRNTCYGVGDLELFTGSFEFAVEGWRTMPIIFLREAAKLQAPWNSFTKNSDIEDSSACSIICDESDIDVDAPQNGVVPVSAGAHVTRNKCGVSFSAEMRKPLKLETGLLISTSPLHKKF